jgi:hypothetical protein
LPPSPTELDAILTVITARIARHLERRGLLIRDLESSHLTRAPVEDAALEILQGHSITYRIAMGSHEGRRAFTLQSSGGFWAPPARGVLSGGALNRLSSVFVSWAVPRSTPICRPPA